MKTEEPASRKKLMMSLEAICHPYHIFYQYISLFLVSQADAFHSLIRVEMGHVSEKGQRAPTSGTQMCCQVVRINKLKLKMKFKAIMTRG